MSDKTNEKMRFLVDASKDLMDWVDAEAAARDRSRAWMIAEILRQYRNRLEKDRQRRERQRQRRARS